MAQSEQKVEIKQCKNNKTARQQHEQCTVHVQHAKVKKTVISSFVVAQANAVCAFIVS